MKKSSLYVLFSITAIGAMLFSGCTSQTTNKKNIPQTIHDEFSTNATGGEYELAGGLAHFSIPHDAVSQQITISMDSVADPPYDTNLTFTDCYAFGPEGILFHAPVILTLHYNSSKIPSTVFAGNLSLFVLSGTTWSKIKNCSVDLTAQTVTGPLLHFSMIGAGYIPPEKLEQTEERNESQENTSASITFEVSPIIVVEQSNTTVHLEGHNITTHKVLVSALVFWERTPYMRYYALTWHYHGNPAEKYGYGTWRDWHGADSIESDQSTWPEYHFLDNTTYYYSNSETDSITYSEYFVTTTYNSKWLIDHGYDGAVLIEVVDYFRSDEAIDNDTKAMQISEMASFVTQYVYHWTITVRPVS